MRYDRRAYRRLRLLLLPLRVAASVAALWAAWAVYDQRVRQADYADVVAPVAFAFVNGLLVGVHLVMCVVLAMYAWYPLPEPRYRRR